VKAIIFGIFVLLGSLVQLFRCVDHLVAYQQISYEFDGSYSPELVYNMDADKDDLPIKKRKTRIRYVDYHLIIIPTITGEVWFVGETPLPIPFHFYPTTHLFSDHSLRGPPFA
jgi:hypothetical protein